MKKLDLLPVLLTVALMSVVLPGHALAGDDLEICDGQDNDGDGMVDEGDAVDATAWYPDSDEDGYGDSSATGILACTAPVGHVADNTDHDDTNPAAHPGATEVCDPDDVDEDGDGFVDDEDFSTDESSKTAWYVDSDADGYGDDSATGILACSAPAGHVADNTDPNDSNPDVPVARPTTATTLNVNKTQDFVKANGKVTPATEDAEMSVKFQRRKDGKWNLIKEKNPKQQANGSYATKFDRPGKDGKYRIVSRFPGSLELKPSKKTKAFELG